MTVESVIRRVLHPLAHGLAGDGERILADDAAAPRGLLEHRRHAAGPVDVLHVNRGERRGDLGDVRHLGGDRLDVREAEGHARLAGDGQHVEHGIGRSAHGHVHHHGVVDGGRGDDVAACGFVRPDQRSPPPDGRPPHQRLALSVRARIVPLPGSATPIASQRQFIELAVNMPEQEPHEGRPVLLDVVQLRVARLWPAAALAPTPRRRELRSSAWPSGAMPGLHRPAGDEHRRHIHAQRAHHHAGHDLVAVGNADHAVEAVGAHHGLDAVGDQFARGQAEYFMPAWPMAMPSSTPMVLNSNGHAAGLADRLLGAPCGRTTCQVDVAGDDVHVGCWPRR